MWMLISLLYRAYCRARLLEMRRYRATTIAWNIASVNGCIIGRLRYMQKSSALQ